MSFAQRVKDTLMKIISDMSLNAACFSNNPDSDFSRNRKLGFRPLLHIIISMSDSTIKDNLLNYFSFDKDTASTSAFFQQRAKLSSDALPFLFREFNRHFDYKLFKGKYHLLVADGSSFVFWTDLLDALSYCPPNGRSVKGSNQVHAVSLHDLISQRFS